MLGEFEDGLTVFRDYFPPGEAAQHGEIDSAETEARDQDVNAIAKRLIIQRIHGLGDGFGVALLFVVFG